MNSRIDSIRISRKATLLAIASLFALACMLCLASAPALADEQAGDGELTACDTASTMSMYRLYNRNTGEHFYTADAAERDNVKEAGWRYEGVGWIAPSTSKTPVYRLYSGTDHHYTVDEAERDALIVEGWKDEGIGWYSEDVKKSKPLYREFNPNVNVNAIHNNSGSHNYTMAFSEHKGLVNGGWRDEGFAWFASGEGELLPNTDPDPQELKEKLNLTEYLQPSLTHGFKGADWQGYIVLHDTEGTDDPKNVVDGWVANGAGIGAHFVVGMDGSIVQAVDIDQFTKHAGWGNTGFNQQFGVRDWPYDGSTNYGMNSCSIGIEMVHGTGQDYYPDAQLEALDALIAYIDAYYGFESTIIDHKTWAIGNSDTSEAFAGYLANYQRHRHH